MGLLAIHQEQGAQWKVVVVVWAIQQEVLLGRGFGGGNGGKGYTIVPATRKSLGGTTGGKFC